MTALLDPSRRDAVALARARHNAACRDYRRRKARHRLGGWGLLARPLTDAMVAEAFERKEAIRMVKWRKRAAGCPTKLSSKDLKMLFGEKDH